MKLTEAIEILESIKDSGIDAGHYEAEDAIELGIEAMKRLEKYRQDGEEMRFTPLPGETED